MRIGDSVKGLLALIAGGGLTVRELLTNGSLLLTCAGGAIAFLGGWWTHKAARVKHATAEVELKIKQAELRRLQSGAWRPRR